MLTVERLKQVLSYDPDTGCFRWLVYNPRGLVGAVAGSRTGGYVKIKIDGKKYRAHRLAVLYMTGKWPRKLVDHRDGNGENNAWDNIRLATDQQNARNVRRRSTNTTGFKGVCKRGSRFHANIRVNGKQAYLGSFKTPEEAHAAYCVKGKELYGDFFNPG